VRLLWPLAIWLTPPAWTKPGQFGRGVRRVKRHVLPVRPARRAGGTAVDAGGFHRVVKGAVGVSVARDDRRPPTIVQRLERPWSSCPRGFGLVSHTRECATLHQGLHSVSCDRIFTRGSGLGIVLAASPSAYPKCRVFRCDGAITALSNSSMPCRKVNGHELLTCLPSATHRVVRRDGHEPGGVRRRRTAAESERFELVAQIRRAAVSVPQTSLKGMAPGRRVDSFRTFASPEVHLPNWKPNWS
jgi:hypothetical protein